MNPVRNSKQHMNTENTQQSRRHDFISNGTKKMILLSGLFLFFGFIPHVFAQGFVPLAVIPGLTDVQATSGGLASFFNNLYKYLIGLAAVLAVIEITWAGIVMAINSDNVSKQSESKERITQAIFGLILVLSPVLIFSIINPNILNLSLSLPALDTKSGPPSGSAPANRAGTSITQPSPSGYVNKLFFCPLSGDCAAAQTLCNALTPLSSGVQCVDSGGKIDLNGKKTFSFVYGVNYCIDGETPAVECTARAQ